MRRLCTIAVGVFAIVFKALHGVGECGLGKPDILADARQVRDPQGRAILFNNVHQGHIIEQQFVLAHFKFPLGKLKCLFNQLTVTLHSLLVNRRLVVNRNKPING
jgi:hypothetical protein